MSEKGIKETQELIAGLKKAFKAGKAVRDIVKDGLSTSDIPEAIQLVKNQVENLEIYDAAIKDVDQVKEELKDLSKDEMLVLFMDLVDAVKKIEKA